jgi:hypothetical protein
MKSSWHNLIPLFPLFCNCQFGRLDLIQLFSTPTLISWQVGVSKLNPSLPTLLLLSLLRRILWHSYFITPRHGPQRKQPLLLMRRVYCPLPSNEHPSVSCVHFTGKCLPNRCLAVGIHVTIYKVEFWTLHYEASLTLELHIVQFWRWHWQGGV